MNLRKLIDKLFGGNRFNKPQENNGKFNKRQESAFEKFTAWFREQNAEHAFAKHIKDGTTVYFSDDFAAAYDLRIVGFGEQDNTIVVQLNLETQKSKALNEYFLEISVNTWSELGWEIWYLDGQLQWLVIANGKDRKLYNKQDVIKSDKINFEFTLEQIL